jgi:hypothetical protein
MERDSDDHDYHDRLCRDARPHERAHHRDTFMSERNRCGAPMQRCTNCDRAVAHPFDACPRCHAPVVPSTCRRLVRAAGLPCRYHGSNPQTLRKVQEREVESDIAQLLGQYDGGPVTNPFASLLELAGEVLAWKNLLGDRVARLRAEEWRWEGRLAEQTRAEVTLYERAMDRAGQLLVSIARLDLDERVARMNARVSELQGAVLLASLGAVLDSLGLGEVVVARAREMLASEIATRTAGASASQTRALTTGSDRRDTAELHGKR